MKKTILITALCFWCLESVVGQMIQSPKVNTINVYGDFSVGPWSSATINMEVRLESSESNKFQLYARGGYGKVHEFSLFCEGRTSKGGILGLTMLVGKGNHHFEISGGAYLGAWKERKSSGSFFCSDRAHETAKLPMAELGYRYQNLNSQFLFRVKLGTLGLGVGLGFCF